MAFIARGLSETVPTAGGGGHHGAGNLEAGGSAGDRRPIVVANEEHRFLVAEQLRQIGAPTPAILLKPMGRNTAPAIAAAASQAIAEGGDPLLLVLPSDHVVRDEVSFHNAVSAAVSAAEAGALVTFGMVPDAPETGFGHIQAEAGSDLRKVLRFVEKPTPLLPSRTWIRVATTGTAACSCSALAVCWKRGPCDA
jgi:mannose-1-phosphate guanylyltransferase